MTLFYHHEVFVWKKCQQECKYIYNLFGIIYKQKQGTFYESFVFVCFFFTRFHSIQ